MSDQLTPEQALGVALSVQAGTMLMEEAQERAPAMLQHLNNMGYDLAANPAPAGLYRCIKCGRNEHGCECEGGGEMVAANPAPAGPDGPDSGVKVGDVPVWLEAANPAPARPSDETGAWERAIETAWLEGFDEHRSDPSHWAQKTRGDVYDLARERAAALANTKEPDGG